MSDEVLAWLQFTIDIEIKGRQFYEECLKHSKDPRSTELFELLIKEEKQHEATLKELLEKKSGSDQAKVKAAQEKYNKMATESPMFSKEDLDAIKDPNALVMEMFNRSAEQEKKGINLYLDIEESSDDPEVKALFHDLAQQEIVHRRKITGLGMHIFGMEEEDEDSSPKALEQELKSMKVIIKEVPVEIKECIFNPKEIKVKKGETVVLKIMTDAPAGLRIVNFQIDEYISPGKETIVKFLADTAGEFNFFSNVPCRLGNEGMRGIIIIEGENEGDEEL